ncbi:MAG TPA: DUF3800 domain-containing protein [Thermoanaerobaculia bacterium]|jgi:hypothetical protein
MKNADFRMFVDEVGHADLGSCDHPNSRYLSLTGIVFELDYYERVVTPWVEKLKAKHFPPLPSGKPLILHRKELVNKNWPFECLRDPKKEEVFNRDLLAVLEKLKYMVLTVSIDKLEHVNRYSVWRYHPYHYCQEVILERYAMWLNKRKSTGDVYAESRGRRDDFQLKKAFRFIYHHGTSFVSREEFQRALVSEDLKLYKKRENIAGLQLADLIAHPSFRWMLAKRSNEGPPQTFGGKIAKILEAGKYDRSPTGTIDRWGCKWLP